MIKRLLLLVLATLVIPSLAQDGARRLPFQTTQEICKRYEGQPAFDREGQTVRINCPWVDKMSVLENRTPIELYRSILDQASRLSDLRSVPLPPDMDCGGFKEQSAGGERKVVCRADLGDTVEYVFVGDSRGDILRMESSLNYKNIYRGALRKSIARGSITRFYEPYVDLQTDLIVEKMKFTATPLDSVRLQGETVSFVVAARRKP